MEKRTEPSSAYLVPLLLIASITLGISGAVAVLWMAMLSGSQLGVDSRAKHGISTIDTSRLGGVGIFCYLFLMLTILRMFPNLLGGQGAPSMDMKLYQIGFIAASIGLIGLLEDFGRPLAAWVRLLVMMSVAFTALLLFNDLLPVERLKPLFGDSELGGLSLVTCSSILLVGFINAGNIADGANGLIGGIGLIFFAIALGLFGHPTLLLLVLGLIAFLMINVSSGRLLLGDFGAYFISAVICLVSFQLFEQELVSLVFLASILSYPCFEILRVIFVRLSKGRSPLVAGDDHTHNMLNQYLKRYFANPLVSNSVTGVGLAVLSAGPGFLVWKFGLHQDDLVNSVIYLFQLSGFWAGHKFLVTDEEILRKNDDWSAAEKEKVICVVGLGYVGLPIALAFGRNHRTIGFDISEQRIWELKGGQDNTLESSREDFERATRLDFTNQQHEIGQANIYIVTVPTPVDENKIPDLEPLKSASRLVSRALKPNDLVIYESTVYPGATEEVCVPILEEGSGLILNKDFAVGYSPERINPGDHSRRLRDIVKVTSGSNEAARILVDELYASIVPAGTHSASSIRVAEAAKVIENTQRDVNIALMNELALIFDTLNIPTKEVLAAAKTKWNFLPFHPGLVGGHCIGVDPYYLTHKAQSMGYSPELVLAGRKINDGMSEYICKRLIADLVNKKKDIAQTKVLMLGLTFKENCPDFRNSKAVSLYQQLKASGLQVSAADPYSSMLPKELEMEIKIERSFPGSRYEAIIIAVPHIEFIREGIGFIKSISAPEAIVYDLMGVFDTKEVSYQL